MILRIKKMLLVGLICVFTLLIGAAIAMNTQIVAMADDSIAITMESGASIRTDGQKAIRFRTFVSKDYIDQNKDNIEVITMITPTRNITDESEFNDDFSGENKKVVFSVKNGNLVDTTGYIVPTKDDNYMYHACIFNVQEQNIARDFSAISYIKLNGVVLEDSYTDISSGNLYDIAKTCLEVDPEFEPGSEEYNNIAALCTSHEATINGFAGETFTLTVKRGQTVAATATNSNIAEELTVEGCAYYEGLGEDANTTLTQDQTFNATMSALEFSLNNEETAYIVSQGTYNYDKYKIVKIPAEYNGKTVNEIASGMFYNTSTYTGCSLEGIYLPSTITTMPRITLCSKLKVLSMPGVNRANHNDGYVNYALDCNKLETLIVGENFSSDGQVFYSRNGSNSNMTVYTTATSGANISFTGTNNNMWNGEIVYYSEGAATCNTWCWEDSAHMGITVNEHSSHNYNEDTGICSNCGDFKSYGLTYTLNNDGLSYSVSAYDSSVAVVKVYAEYDGKPVTSIGDEVFYSTQTWNGNAVIKELYLPTTITRMPKMKLCANLEVLSMPGVTNVTSTEREFARNCPKLKTVIVGNTFTCIDQVFYNASTQNYDMTIYTTATSSTTITLAGTQNDMWNGQIVYYSEGAATCNTWCWKDSAHMGITVNEHSSHNYNEDTGICSNCGDFKSYGLTYTLNNDGLSYSVSAYDSSVAVVKVYAEYDGKPVTSIGDEVFYSTQTWNGNAVIKELYLPTTITRMPKMKLCANLEVLSMPGVTNVASTEKEFARNCPKLKTVIVGNTFTCIDQVFYNASTQNYDMTIYTTATSSTTISLAGTHNDMWNGQIMYYDDTLSHENTWRWTDSNHISIEIYDAE